MGEFQPEVKPLTTLNLKTRYEKQKETAASKLIDNDIHYQLCIPMPMWKMDIEMKMLWKMKLRCCYANVV